MSSPHPQRPLFAPSPASWNLTAVYHWPRGWTVHLTVRCEGETSWSREHYEDLTTEEMADVVDATTATLFPRG